jgi:hypothetical protein
MLNVTSLAKPNAKQHLTADIRNASSDIALIVETWFCDKHCDTELAIDEFVLFQHDRKSGRKGSGLCAYVGNNICCEILDISDCNSMECSSNSVEIMWLLCQYKDAINVIGLCYHPPAPLYKPVESVSQLSSNIDTIMQDYHVDILVVTGDFNPLDIKFLVCNYGHIQIVDNPTHGRNLIDKVCINRSDLYCASVCTSFVHIKHKAVTAAPRTRN